MTKYYKIIFLPDSMFARQYGLSEEYDIMPGQRFTAHGKKYEWCCKTDKKGFVEDKVSICTADPVIHFCDNAIDALLWADLLNRTNADEKYGYFYEVQPLGHIYKQQCNDNDGYFQCGAHRIEILRRVSNKEMLRLGAQEIDENASGIIQRYPHKNMIRFMNLVKCRAQ